MMAPLISDCYTPEKEFFTRPSFAQECAYDPIVQNTDNYYMLTEFLGHPTLFNSSNVITYTINSDQAMFHRQMHLISFANQMFKGSKPLIGRELKILKRTVSRLISKTPTTLHKK